MVARLLWEQDAAGSSPVTSTKNPLKHFVSGDFMLVTILCIIRLIIVTSCDMINIKVFHPFVRIYFGARRCFCEHSKRVDRRKSIS